MQNKTFGSKVFLQFVKRIFRPRNIIIVSDHKVGHVPLSGVMQVLILIGLIGFFSGVSYITGSYMTADAVIKEKEKKLASSSIDKRRLSDEMNMLKEDLVRLDKNGDALSDYSKFIANHNSNVLSQTMDLSFGSVREGVLGQNDNKLLAKIAFLERRVDDVRNENANLVLAIRLRTDKRIDYLKDIISMTGLDPGRIESIAKTESNDAGKKISLRKNPDAEDDDESEDKEDNVTNKDNQGGPFIPLESTSFNETEQSLLADVDRLVLLNSVVHTLPLSWPMDSAQETGPFGKRIDPINGRWAMHPGVDLVGPTGSKICATNNGVVTAAGHRPAYGNMVDIQHKFGIVTRYAHMSKILVSPGDKVTKGQVIGIQGSTGRSTGQHLHYEVRINDHPVNPINFLNAGEYVLEN